MLIQLPAKPWKNLPATGSGPTSTGSCARPCSPSEEPWLSRVSVLPQNSSEGSARGIIPTASLCSWERGQCVSQSCLELSDSAELKPLCRMWRSHLGVWRRVPAQALVWANTRDWPQLPNTGTGCTAPAPPGLLQGQSTGNKSLRSFRDSLDVFCVHDSTFSPKHQEFSQGD